MSALGRAWRAFRRLPAGVQAAIGIGVLAAYTLALVVLLSGDGDDSKAERRPLSAEERSLKQLVEQGRVPQRDPSDVAAFRRPNVVAARCEGTSCNVSYSIAVPGRGRIALQQVDIVARVFDSTDIEQLELRVVRAQPTGPQASPKSEEETPVGVALYATECDRNKGPENVRWERPEAAQAAFSAMCKTRDLFEAGPGGAPGAPGTGGGGE